MLCSSVPDGARGKKQDRQDATLVAQTRCSSQNREERHCVVRMTGLGRSGCGNKEKDEKVKKALGL